MNRREFIAVSALAGGGLLLTLSPWRGTRAASTSNTVMNLYVSIASDNTVSITAPVPEIGQGVRTALPMLVAEELDVDWRTVKVVQALGSQDYEGGFQRAAGSNSVRVFWEPMRRAGAVARELLRRAAANRWQVVVDDCTTASGFVVHAPSDRRLSYGELAIAAAALVPNPEVALKKAADFRLLGTRVSNVDAADIVTGKSIFGADVRLPGMAFASIERCPVYAGKVISFDDADARSVSGFLQSVAVQSVGNPERPYVREGVAVIATSTWAAFEARKRLRIRWDTTVNASESTERLHAQCAELLEKPAAIVRNDGDADEAIATAARTLAADYHVPFIVHTPMETMNCTADVHPDRATIWVPTQMPAATRSDIAGRLQLPEEAVVVRPTRVGGGFGRRLSTDFVIEAVELSRASGRPVQVVWTREDEIQQGEFRPFSYHRLRAALDTDGRVTAWVHKQASTSRYAFRQGRDPAGSEFFENDFPAHLIANFRLEYALARSNLPRTILRAPGHNSLAFVIESFIDELAHFAGQDPLQFRLQLLGQDADYLYGDADDDDPEVISSARMRAVLERAAAGANWDAPLAQGRGRGIACHYTFGSYVAHVVEVTATDPDGLPRIDRVVSAVDCGSVANLLGLEAQIEGGIIDGLSAALYGEIKVTAGVVQQDNFDSYRLLRFGQAPVIEPHVIVTDFPPTGMGEPPYPPLAPALCNAIFAATGVRRRRLPLATT